MTTNKTSLSRLTKVRHRNELNSTLSTLPMAAKKVLFLAMCQINSKNEFDDDHIFYVTVADYIKWVQVKPDAAYLALRDGSNILDTTLLKLKHDEILELSSDLGFKFTKSNVPDSMNLSLTVFSTYYRNEGRVGIKFTKEAKRFLCKLIGEEKRYTTQVLLSVVRLTSVNAASLYQLIRKIYSNNSRANSFEMTIDELKDELNLYTIGAGGVKDYKYPDYPAFKRDVLNKSVKEIMKHTEVKNLSFVVSEKIGRKVYKLKFSYTIGYEGDTREDSELTNMFDKMYPPEN
ncbi:replication initiation protein [Escherichia coli]|nr:replication initiation protein [Escherichia coli]MCV5237641.1 replication initiation protein [Escherichia coli]MCV5305662.1 replication initiation protein [Escherichia coli]HCW2949029.1 replication initiation protein [Escherichia coli]